MTGRYRVACPGFKVILKYSYFVHHIFPAESGRPQLSYIENVENSDYINACYVDVSGLCFFSKTTIHNYCNFIYTRTFYSTTITFGNIFTADNSYCFCITQLIFRSILLEISWVKLFYCNTLAKEDIFHKFFISSLTNN